MDRLSFGQLEVQRSKMTLRLRSFDVPDVRLHRRATVELKKRLDDWLGNALPPLSRFADIDPRELSLPVEVITDQVELLIVHAVGGGEEFGVSARGAVFVVDPDTGDHVFIAGLSPLLDEATDIFYSFNRGGGQFFEYDGVFLTDDGIEFFSADLASKPSTTEPHRPAGKSLWQQIISVLPWVHDEPAPKPHDPPKRPPPPPTPPDPDLDLRPIYKLHVDLDTSSWPPTGVLGAMGYKVGKDGLPTAARREILRQVVRVELSASSREAESYIHGWGSPSSSRRVRKMYNSIASFSRNLQSRDADTSVAIADWESDLNWLERTYGVAD